VVIPPSIHVETGEEYQWEHGWGPFDVEMVELTPAQIEFLGLGSTSAQHTLGRPLDERDYRTAEILCSHAGGHSMRVRGERIEICRPGKERGSSVEIGYGNPGGARFWTPNWPLFEGRWYDAWEIRKICGVPEHQFHIRPAEHDHFVLVNLLKSRAQRWLWHNFLPAGQFTLMVGPEKLGKSTGAVWLAARASRGELEGDYAGEPITVAIASAEDDAERAIKPRLVAAKADLGRVMVLDPLGPGFSFDSLSGSGARLIVLDPISVFIELTSSNEHGEVNVRNALHPFARLAHEHDVTVVGIRHPRKSGTSDNPFDIVLGSRAWSAAARSVLFFTKDKEAPDRPGGLLFARGNLAPQSSAYRYSLDPMSVLLDDGNTTEVPLFVFDPQPMAINLDDALGSGHSGGSRQQAEDFLVETLLPGALAANDIFDLADQEDITRRTVQRAKKALDIRSFKRDAQWYWELPKDFFRQIEPQGSQRTPSIGGDVGPP
jgi:hypothetical protein